MIELACKTFIPIQTLFLHRVGPIAKKSAKSLPWAKKFNMYLFTVKGEKFKLSAVWSFTTVGMLSLLYHKLSKARQIRYLRSAMSLTTFVLLCIQLLQSIHTILLHTAPKNCEHMDGTFHADSLHSCRDFKLMSFKQYQQVVTLWPGVSLGRSSFPDTTISFW